MHGVDVAKGSTCVSFLSRLCGGEPGLVSLRSATRERADLRLLSRLCGGHSSPSCAVLTEYGLVLPHRRAPPKKVPFRRSLRTGQAGSRGVWRNAAGT